MTEGTPPPTEGAGEGESHRTLANTSTEGEGEGNEPPSTEPFSIENFTIPEEYAETFELLDEDKEALAELAAKHGISQAAMEDLANTLFFPKLSATAETLNTGIEEEWERLDQDWTASIYEKYGGEDGARKAAGNFAFVIDQYGGEELRTMMEITNAGNNPAFFNFMVNVAEALREGGHVGNNAAPRADRNPLEEMYDNSPDLHRKT